MADQKPEMRKYAVSVDEGSGTPRVFQIDAAYHTRQQSGIIDFKDDNGKIVLTFPADRLIFILTQSQSQFAAGGPIPSVKGGDVD